MNDQQIDDLVRQTSTTAEKLADLLDLRRSGQELLEEIMSTPKIVQAASPGNPARIIGSENDSQPVGSGIELETGPRTLHSRRRRRVPIAVAAAVAVAAAIAGPTIVFHHRHQAGPASTGIPHLTATPPTNAPAVAVALTPNPWLLPTGQEWKITYVDEFADNGEIRFEADTRFLQVDWYRSSLYKGFYQDRRRDAGKPVPQTVLGVDGTLFPFGSGLFHLLLPPHGNVFLEISGQARDQAAFVGTLDSLSKVSPEQWYAAMPASVVTPSQKPAASAKMLADVPLPPGFDRSKVLTVGATIRYNYVDDVTTSVVCSWLADYQQARNADDAKEMTSAARALGSSRHWKVLHGLNEQTIWDYADRAAKGKSVSGYHKSLDCP